MQACSGELQDPLNEPGEITDLADMDFGCFGAPLLGPGPGPGPERARVGGRDAWTTPMSVPSFGRITPLQADMLALGGIICGYPGEKPSDHERMQEMCRALEHLRRHTGQDFGLDLQRWHTYLLESEEHREEYTFHYAWEAVRQKILELIGDQERVRLVELASRSLVEKTSPRGSS
jgi:hypothetical protein